MTGPTPARGHRTRSSRTTGHRTPRTASRFVGLCPTTGKRQYPDRRTAKTVNRMIATGSRVYRHTGPDGCGYWHLGTHNHLTRDEHRELHNHHGRTETNRA